MSRQKGTPNRITSATKGLISQLILGQTDRIQEALDEVFECNKREYLQIMVRLLPYVMPKATGGIHRNRETPKIELVHGCGEAMIGFNIPKSNIKSPGREG